MINEIEKASLPFGFMRGWNPAEQTYYGEEIPEWSISENVMLIGLVMVLVGFIHYLASEDKK